MYLQLFTYGLLEAVTISSVAVALSLLYNATKTLNFALAIGFSTGGYAAYILKIVYQQDIWLVISGSLLACAILGALMELLIFNKLFKIKASTMVELMSSLGVYLAAVNIFALSFSSEILTLRPGIDNTFSPLGVILTETQLFQLGVEISSLATLFCFLKCTPFGLQIRAFSDNQILTEALGFNLNGLRLLVTIISFGLIGTIGALYSLDFGVYPFNGMPIFLLAAIAMIIGGVGNIRNALIGGFLLGISRNLLLLVISDQWQSLITFSILGLILIFRPRGILALKIREDEV